MGTSGRAGFGLRILVLLALLVAAPAIGEAKEPGAAYVIAVHLSSDTTPAGNDQVAAIKELTLRRVAMINEDGGVLGRPLEVIFYDDENDGAKTVASVEDALAKPDLIGMVGIWTSTRGALVVDRIGLSGVPFVSEISVEKLFEKHPNIYTLTRSIRDEQEVFAAFVRDNFTRIAFVGAEDDLYTRTYHGYLQKLQAPASIVSTFWLKGNVDEQPDTIAAAVEDLKNAGPDLIFLSVGSRRGAAFLKALTAAGVAVPAFVALGNIAIAVSDNSGGGLNYGGSLYEIAEGGISNLNNERLEELMRKSGSVGLSQSYSAYAVGYGARYSDQIAMMAEFAAKSPAPGAATVRRTIADALASLREGRSAWPKGWAQNWTFSTERASAERSLIVWRPAGETKQVLAPIQYVRNGGVLGPVPVLYVHLNMMRIARVDSSDKSFEAEFFFTMRSKTEVPLSAIEFTNAYHSADSAEPLISSREVWQEQRAAAVQEGFPAKIYKITGKFLFEPNLRKYPFDEQVFSISFQPAQASLPFLLQPPDEDVRNAEMAFRTDGWTVESHYVGTNEQLIRTVGGAMSDQRAIPYYNFNYTWVMSRGVVDYLLRVVVPLGFILIVSYLANFIPRSEFEAIMAIQVTALLSAIALYLALNQPSAEGVTLSDQIFVMAYATISAMIALSILEVNTTVIRSAAVMRVIHVVQIYLLPLAAAAMLAYVLASAASTQGLMGVMRGWLSAGG